VSSRHVHHPRYFTGRHAPTFSQHKQAGQCRGFSGFASVASLWEIAIKSRLGKLDPGVPLEDMRMVLEGGGLTIIPIEIPHVITAAEPEPETRDPFDRLLLAQCQVEGLQLVTIDRALVGHRLAFKF
jgi:PIN domain nuclease of toxin-antitoxin system